MGLEKFRTQTTEPGYTNLEVFIRGSVKKSSVVEKISEIFNRHDQEVKTLGYKMERRQVKIKRQSPCLRCQMNGLVAVKNEKHDKHTATFCRECGCPPINGKNGCYCYD